MKFIARPTDGRGHVVDALARAFDTAQERDDYARSVVAETGRTVLRQRHNGGDMVSEAAFTSEWSGDA